MKKGVNKIKILKVILWIIIVYHILFGILTFLPVSFGMEILKLIFNMSITLTPQFTYILKITGAYMFIFGLFMFFAVKDPVKYKPFIICGAVLYGFRIIVHLLNKDELIQSFGISPLRFWIEIILLAFFGISLYILMPKK